MVSDLLFYTVLTIAIVLGVIFTIFLLYVKKMMPHPLMMKVLSTLHACLFGYESALIELIGPRGYKTHVFPKIVETIAKLKGEDDLIEAVMNAKSPKEAMEKWIEVLKLTKIDPTANITENGPDSLTINIPHCTMCNPIHDIMGTDAKGICPMALIVVGAGGFVDTDKTPVIDYSKLSKTGTTTEVRFEEIKS